MKKHNGFVLAWMVPVLSLVGCFDFDSLTSGGPKVVVMGAPLPAVGPSSAPTDSLMPMVCLKGENFDSSTSVKVGDVQATYTEVTENGTRLCFRLPMSKNTVGPVKIVVATNVKFPVEVNGFSYYLGTVKWNEKQPLDFSTKQVLSLSNEPFVLLSAQLDALGKPATLVFGNRKDIASPMEIWTLAGAGTFKKSIAGVVLNALPAAVVAGDFDGVSATQEIALVTGWYPQVPIPKDVYDLHVMGWDGSALKYVVSGMAAHRFDVLSPNSVINQLAVANLDGGGPDELLVGYLNKATNSPKMDVLKRASATPSVPFVKDISMGVDLSASLPTPLLFATAADLNSDGKVDVISGGNTVVARNSLGSTFAPAQPALDLGPFAVSTRSQAPGIDWMLPVAWSVGIEQQKPASLFISGDQNGKAALGIWSPIGMGTTPLGAMSYVQTNSQPVSMAAVDVNLDGRMDVVVLVGKTLLPILQDPDQTTVAWKALPAVDVQGCSGFLTQVAVLDTNKDGRLDVVLTCSGSTAVSLLENISE